MSDLNDDLRARLDAAITEWADTGKPDAYDVLNDALDMLDELKRVTIALKLAQARADDAEATIERVRKIDTGNSREFYGVDFEAGMARALWLVKGALGGDGDE